MKRRFGRAALGALWLNALAIALGWGLPVVAAEVKEQPITERAADDATQVELAKFELPDSPATQLPQPFKYRWANDRESDIASRAKPDLYLPTRVKDHSLFPTPQLSANDGYRPPHIELAQFQLPPTGPDEVVPSTGAPPRPLVRHLTYQYSYGSESDITYRANMDLDKRIKDNIFIPAPQMNGLITYRPFEWLETTLEMIIEREISALEPLRVRLPDRSIQTRPQRKLSLLVDQALVTIKEVTAPFEFTLGRRNYEDERHWLWDTSIDVARVGFQLGQFRADASFGRQVLMDLDLAQKQLKDRRDTYILYGDYRGIEDIRLAAYVVYREDRDRHGLNYEGRPLHIGFRSQGRPWDALSYWFEHAQMRGYDESLATTAGQGQARRRNLLGGRAFKAYAFDYGATYRFLDLPFIPSITFGSAFGSGQDFRKTKGWNHEFRQTGLQTNETRFAGVAEYKIYGEALDPELSNIKIITVALGFRPMNDTSVDFVYHNYRLSQISDTFHSTALTKDINSEIQARFGKFSKEVGDGFDVVLGFRSLFGIRRLGLDLRMGWFYPGKAYLKNFGTNALPDIRSGSKAIATVAKIWW